MLAVGILIAAAIPLAIMSRYEVWLRLRSTSRSVVWNLPGWAIPWLGLATLAILAGVIAGVVVLAVHRGVGSGIGLATLGWIMTLPAALVLVVVRASPVITLPAWLSDHLHNWAIDAGGLPGVGSVVPKVPGHLVVSVTVGPGPSFLVLSGGLLAMAGLIALGKKASTS